MRLDRRPGPGPLPGRPVLRARRRRAAADRRRFGIFGHGNVAGVGQALLEQPDDDAVRTSRATSRRWSTPPSATRARRTACSTLACTSSIGPGATNMVTGAALATINRLPVLLLPGDIFATRRRQPGAAGARGPDARSTSRSTTRFKPGVALLRPHQPARAARLPAAGRDARAHRPGGDRRGHARAAAGRAGRGVRLAGGAVRAARLARPPRRRPSPTRWREAADAAARRAAPADRRRRRHDLRRGDRTRCAASPRRPASRSPRRRPARARWPTTIRRSLGAIGATGTTAANAHRPRGRRHPRRRHALERLHDRVAHRCSPTDVRFVNLNVASVDAFKHAGAAAGRRRARRGWRRCAARSRAGLRTPTTPSGRARLAAEWDATVEHAYTLGHGPLPAQSEVIGVVNRVSGPRDVVVCAAGSMPGDLHKLWRTRDPKGYHVEYGYSCMGYEIAGGLGVKLAAPDREVFVMVGDGSYLMMAQEIVTAVQEGVKLTIVLVQNHGFASIGALSESLGSQRFGTRYRTARRGPAADGRARGPRRARASAPTTLDELEAGAARRAPASPSCRSRPTRSCPRPDSRGVVGRAGRRGLRPRLHARRARDLRARTSRPSSST